MNSTMLDDIKAGNTRALSRAISLLSNTTFDLLKETAPNVPVLGITGPPGAGKSTLTDKLVSFFVRNSKSVAILCVDPSSPFTRGAILGDRIRMSDWYNHPNVFIRSLATRGSLGGLPPKAADIVKLISLAPFDIIIIETVGVGQNEVEISSIADLTVVVLVPEAGDEVQFMKAGLMETADIFVVNKCDRPGADIFAKSIRDMLHDSSALDKPIVKTIANTNMGVGELYHLIEERI